jgi:hypothetical protein
VTLLIKPRWPWHSMRLFLAANLAALGFRMPQIFSCQTYGCLLDGSLEYRMMKVMGR